MERQNYIDEISDWLDEQTEKTLYIHGVFFYTEDSEEGEGDELEVYEIYKTKTIEDVEMVYVSFWGSDEDVPLDVCTDYEIGLIYKKVLEEDDWNPDMDTEALISELGITADMDCDEVYDKVHAYIRKPYDGQVGDVLFMDEANEKTEEICKILGIEFVPAK